MITIEEKQKQVEKLLRSFEKTKPSKRKQPRRSSFIENASIAEPMAIIGLSGRYPQSESIDEFWNNLIENKNCIREFMNERYDFQAYYGDPKVEVGKTNIRHFGLLDEIYRFDAQFFNISDREAEVMDPHMRLMLETVWSCIENAGYNPKSLDRTKTGVFVSFYNYEYGSLLQELEIEKSSEPYIGPGIAGAIYANRISYVLGLNGPSEVYNTACSTVLVALNRAIQSILAGECHQALITGVSLLLTPGRVVALSKLGILNESPVCNPFSYPANKEVIGEGVGAMLIKPLEKAIEANDYVYAVVNGSDVNHHGNLSGGLTLPSSTALSELISSTYRKLKIQIQQLCYIEGHGAGNGTDVSELIALQDVFSEYGISTERKIAIGSVKSNIGFGEGSGGMAQLTKCALSFNYGMIPATLHFEKTDPIFDVKNSNLKIQTSNTPVDCMHEKKYMSIIAYGIGGTNAHVVMSNHIDFKKLSDYQETIGSFPIIFSAKTEDSLRAYVQIIFNHLRLPSMQARYQTLCQRENVLLKSLSLTLIGRERHLPCRTIFVINSYESLLNGCEQFLANQSSENVFLADETQTHDGTDEFLESCLREKKVRDLAISWVNGNDIPWPRLYNDPSFQKIALPPLPFGGKIHQLKKKNSKAPPPGIEERMVTVRKGDITEVSVVLSEEDYFIHQHVVDGIPIMPAVGYLALLSRIALRVFKIPTCSIRNVAWLMPFDLRTGTSTMLFEFSASGHFQIFKKEDQKLCCKGQLHLNESPNASDFTPQVQSSALEKLDPIIGREHYWSLVNSPESKQSHGADFQRLAEIYHLETSICGVLDPLGKTMLLSEIPFYDSSLVMLGGFGLIEKQPLSAAVPFAMDQFHFLRPVRTKAPVYAVAKKREGKLSRYDISIEDGKGDIYATIQGFSIRSIQQLPSTTKSENSADPIEPMIPIPSTRNNGEVKPDDGLPEEQRRTVSNPADNEILKKFILTEFQKNIADFLRAEIEDVSVDESLESLGLDSIGVNELTNQISLKMKIDIPATTLFEYTTLNEVVDFLFDEFEEEIRQYVQDRSKSSSLNTENYQSATNINFTASAPSPKPKSQTTQQPFHASVTESRPSEESGPATDIAVVGIGGIFPGASNFQEFWQKIKTGHDLITELPESRRDSVYNVYNHEIKDLKGIHGGFVEDADKFDASFFGISEEEVVAMDPQQRLFLEATWGAVEDAGYYPPSLAGQTIGVYVGAIVNEYATFLKDSQSPISLFHAGTGNSLAGIANRTSYFFNLRGPSQAIDTACCSSLYAIDRAVKDIQHGECEAAIAGGVNFICSASGFHMYSAMDYLAKDWRCKTFADGGDGWSKGELFAAIFIKKYDHAMRDKDHIYGIIKSTGTNHGGKGYFYTQPNSNAHVELIKQVYRKAGVDPRTVAHVEAHGSGTEMGDALEFNSFSRALKELAKEKGVTLSEHHCGVGSIKSNIGHTEAAAGIAGFIKTTMLLSDKIIPPSLHIETINKNIRLKKSPLFLARNQHTLPEPESQNGAARYASVHSFNFSGATAHAVLAEHIPKDDHDDSLKISSYPICLSAKSSKALYSYCKELSDFLKSAPTLIHQFERIVYTINLSKSFLNHRLALKVTSFADLLTKLKDISNGFAENGFLTSEGIVYNSIDRKSSKNIQYPFLQDQTVDHLVELWTTNSKFDWSIVLKSYGIQKISLPTYPFENDTSYFPKVTKALMPKKSVFGQGKNTKENSIKSLIPSKEDTSFGIQELSVPEEPITETFDSTLSLNIIEDQVRRILGKILSMPHVEIDLGSAVSEYSFDSLKIVSFSETINKRFFISTTPLDFFEFNTLNEVVTFIQASITDNRLSPGMDTGGKEKNETENNSTDPSSSDRVQASSQEHSLEHVYNRFLNDEISASDLLDELQEDFL